MADPTFPILIAGLSALLVGSLGASMAAAARSDLDTARAATARFNSVRQAEAAGYGLLPEGAPLHECIESLDGSGAMGFHLINGTLLDGTVEPAQPEALRHPGVLGAPVWLWEENPSGLFAAFNPTVSCD